MLFEKIRLPLLGDDRGSLAVLESTKNVPFPINRVYYIFGTQQGVSRGFHAHKALLQLAVCVAGKCRMVLDNGEVKETVWLDSPTKCITIEPNVWHEMHDFSEDCVLLVLASEHYDESDYIRDYDDFLKQVGQ
jgi:dTDP-4-dehydrorhamnose 3,5-epimerase-like enzyme